MTKSMMRYPYDNSCCGSKEKKKYVVLTFKRAELIYDVSNYSFVEADILPEGEECRRHQMSDIAQDGNVDRVTRVLNMAHAECVEMLYPYTKEEIPDEQEVLDDVLEEPETYEIKLTLPESFSLTTLRMLGPLIHEYLVCRVLADWMSITNPESEAVWEKKFTTLRNKIQTGLVSRTEKIKRRLKPF
jgi:hypothetical protein